MSESESVAGGAREPALAAVAIVRSTVHHLHGDRSADALADTLILELVAQDGPTQVAQVISVLAGIAAAATITLAEYTEHNEEELLDSFASGVEGWEGGGHSK